MKDEEKWFRFFSKTSLIASLLSAIPAALIGMLFDSFGLRVVGIIVAVAIVLTVFLLTTIQFSVEEHRMTGAGQYVYKVLLLKLQHKLSQRIYIKPNGEETDEEEVVEEDD